MNPVNASNQTFGCHGTSPLEHIFVYWGAPLLAAAIAVVLHRNLAELTMSVKSQEMKMASQKKKNDDFNENHCKNNEKLTNINGNGKSPGEKGDHTSSNGKEAIQTSQRTLRPRKKATKM